MSKDLIISMLKQGQNGNQILTILDTIISDSDSDTSIVSVEPTLDDIQF